MEGVERVYQEDDTHVRWTARIAGIERTWLAEIVRQVPDSSISWRGFGEADNNGTVSFESIAPDRTRVTVRIEWEPKGATEKIAQAMNIIEARVVGDLERFKQFIEGRGAATGAWRGEVSEASTLRSDEPRESPMRKTG
jgi:uncharacterized membrane protein